MDRVSSFKLKPATGARRLKSDSKIYRGIYRGPKRDNSFRVLLRTCSARLFCNKRAGEPGEPAALCNAVAEGH